MKNFALLHSILFAWILIAQPAFAADKCSAIFTSEIVRERSSAIKKLYKAFPKMKESTDQIVQTIRDLKFEHQNVSSAKELSKRTYLEGPNDHFSRLPSRLTAYQKSSVVAVHNKLLNTGDFADYIRNLMEDCALYMAQNKDALTMGYEVSDGYKSGFNFPSAKTKVPKKSYLESGLIDRHSIYKILVGRARTNGEEIAFIHEDGFDSNSTKAQKYEKFHDVPRRGPFFDMYFQKDSDHGQAIHMLQMDYVRSTVHESTKGKPWLFWNYITNYRTKKNGTWAWDTFFDGFNQTLMEPEFVKPLLTDKIQIF